MSLELKKYRLTFDIHTHTQFSHGKGSIADNVKAAAARGLSRVGISDHGPGHLTYGVKRRDFQRMRQEVESLKPLYPNLKIELGVEANIINPSGRLDLRPDEMDWFDYILAGYHFGVLGEAPWQALRTHSLNLVRSQAQKMRNTELVIKALHQNRIYAVTHPGDKGTFDIPAIAAACLETGTLLEISNSHEAPTENELRTLVSTENRFIISSDAHRPEHVGEYREGLTRALAAGIDPARIENIELVDA